jgi:hypothetical protein
LAAAMMTYWLISAFLYKRHIQLVSLIGSMACNSKRHLNRSLKEHEYKIPLLSYSNYVMPNNFQVWLTFLLKCNTWILVAPD